jgi:CheY-like chemotaxis protein
MSPLTILLVEDNPGDARLLREVLRDGDGEGGEPAAVVVHVERLGDAGAVLAARPVDAVLLDLSLPDARGLDTVLRMRALAPALPIVVLTGLADEAVAVEAVQAGAQD